MSVNTAHANNGVLIHAGEYILIHSDNISMDFSGQDNPIFRGSKQGRIYLTSHRLIFNNKKSGDEMQSFSAPFIAMNDVELEQPVFGANYIKGKVRAQPNGNFVGEVKFKLYFKSGGAIEYGMALLRAAKTAQSNYHNSGGGYDDPPPYTPSGNWHEAPPPAYQPPPGYYGWLPQHDAFSGPAPNTVFMSDNPPPYPGIGGPPPAYNPQAQGLYPSVPTHPYNPQQQQPYNPQPYNPQPYNPPAQDWSGFGMPQQPPPQQQHQQNQNQNQQQRNGSNNSSQQQEEMPSWNGFSLPPPDEEERQQQRQQQNQQSSAPPAHTGGWGGGYPQPPPYGAPSQPYPPYPVYPPQSGYPPYPPQPQQFGGGFPPYPPAAGGPPPPAGGMGFTAPPANSKEAEALASAFNTTENQRQNRPGPSDMPPAYEDLPPNYNDPNRRYQ
ncbi:WW domain-binding protein 2 isoform X1 [Calliphora vicina]|uniref:WW domain-binding protein 2 isoform X1 n=1 Tax=Calliphora vicina TaxID=7373 RepID=UPI00325AA8D7